ncbi:MAG: site-2 protease family protein [Candidatus Thermoplasmatota archaeon]|nr:site-2 protease family protein [Candidatus Thermoplasmatota archaeon]MBS3789881.1 site-2 protease family protein [Candidatus Thermoplasmatota archaeon]
MNRGYTRINIQNQKGLSSVEIKHLLVALGVLTLAFAISFVGGASGIVSPSFPMFLIISFLSVGTAFIFHELAHRKLARSYGCWAEFRMWRWGLMLALIFSFFGFVFAAPGAVMIRGHITREENGKISAAGPATNWVVGTVFLIGSYAINFYGLGLLSFVLAFVAFVNLFIGGFNLLPLGPLDGRKIFGWSVKNYIILIMLIGGTLASGYYLGPFSAFF